RETWLAIEDRIPRSGRHHGGCGRRSGRAHAARRWQGDSGKKNRPLEPLAEFRDAHGASRQRSGFAVAKRQNELLEWQARRGERRKRLSGIVRLPEDARRTLPGTCDSG